MRRPILCNDIVFKTLKELETYTYKIKNTINECDSIKSDFPNEFKFLIELLKRHPEYEQKTHKMVDLKSNMNKKGTGIEINIINDDGTITSVSIITAIKGKLDSIEQETKRALRVIIQPQIDEYKRMNRDMITHCSLCSSNKCIQIDHEIWFDKLFYDFIKVSNITLPLKLDKMKDGTNHPCFYEKDKHIGELFYDYHQTHAILRPLCKKCNLSRPKYKKIY
jgi:hypothetical protein